MTVVEISILPIETAYYNDPLRDLYLSVTSLLYGMLISSTATIVLRTWVGFQIAQQKKDYARDNQNLCVSK